ncbi:hypothetical protein [Scytonema sp. HK-05]|nr:hypothetical protein [Scytonema sp. HK-05]
MVFPARDWEQGNVLKQGVELDEGVRKREIVCLVRLLGRET